jgi:hypothetical protein
MLNIVLLLIFWMAYVMPIAIPLLWLATTLVMYSRQLRGAKQLGHQARERAMIRNES